MYFSQEDRISSLVTKVQEKSTQCYRLHKVSTAQRVFILFNLIFIFFQISI